MVTVPFVSLGSLVLDGTDEYGVEWTCGPVQGWGAPASSLPLVKKPRGHGSWAGQGYSQHRTLVLEGTVWAPTAALFEDALDRLNTAASLDESVLTVHGAARDRWVRVRRSGEVLAPPITPQFARWSVQLVAPDPRRFGAVLTGSTGLPVSSGGLVVPFTVPFTVDATTTAGSVSLYNPGNVAGPVWLRVAGPVSAPVVTHVSDVTSPRALVFSSSLVLGSGQFVSVDMEARTVLENDQASRNGWVTSRGWSSFEPGWNTWSFAAGSFDAGSLLTVTAYEAWD